MSKLITEEILLWIWRGSLFVAILVGMLSWKNGIMLTLCVLRAALTFIVLYRLTTGLVYLFQKAAPSGSVVGIGGSDKGIVFDTLVGLEGAEGLETERLDSKISPGQIQPGLGKELLDRERQSEILQRMGF